MNESPSIPVDQRSLIKKINLYQYYHGRPPFLSKEGFCNALTSLYQLRGEDALYNLIMPVLRCPDSCIMLLGDQLEPLINELLGLQNMDDHLTGVRQTDISTVIDFMTNKEGTWKELHEDFNLSFQFSDQQLRETLEMLRTSTLIDEDCKILIGGLQHVVGVTYEGGKYVLYDANDGELDDKGKMQKTFNNEEALVAYLKNVVFANRIGNYDIDFLPLCIQIFHATTKTSKIRESSKNETDSDVNLDTVIEANVNTNKKELAQIIKPKILSNLCDQWKLITNDELFKQQLVGSKGYTSLYIAIAESDIFTVNYIFKELNKNKILSDCMLNCKLKGNTNLLQLAVINKNTDLMLKLLDKGVDYKALDNNNCNVFHYAVMHLDINNFITLLDKLDEIDVDFLDENNRKKWLSEWSLAIDGETPLFLAAASKKNDFVEFLLRNAVPPDMANNTGITPCMAAAQLDNTEAIQLLIEYQTNLMLKDDNDKTALHYAAESKCLKAFMLILQQEPTLLNEKDKDGHTPLDLLFAQIDYQEMSELLAYAVKNNNDELKNQIITQQDALKEIENKIFDAVGKNDITELQVLLENNKQKMLIIEKAKMTALIEAAKAGKTQIVALLLQHGINPDSLKIEGKSALYAAIESDHDEVAMLLLKYGANPNVYENYKNKDGQVITYSPLFAAFERRNVSLLKELLQVGADPTIKIKYNNTWISINPCNPQCIDILPVDLKNQCTEELKEFWTVESVASLLQSSDRVLSFCDAFAGKDDLFTKLINLETACEPLNYRIVNGATLLHVIARQENVKTQSVVDYLINVENLDVNAQDFDGNTPLHYALLENNVFLINYFLEHKNCRIDIKNNDGLTAREYAELLSNTTISNLFSEKINYDLLNTGNNETVMNVLKQPINFGNDPYDNYSSTPYQVYNTSAPKEDLEQTVTHSTNVEQNVNNQEDTSKNQPTQPPPTVTNPKTDDGTYRFKH